ncbi:MAG: nucleoside deaminase [Bacilli bacterium]|nr:nucleoside deaminase [Bacilli bacterium]
MNQLIYDELNKLVDKAIKKDEVPVAALIVKEGKIIAKAYNKTNISNNVLDHAEIICINKASKRLHNWRLNDCELYVTLEPCSMCKEVIKKSRVGKVYYILNQNEYETESNPSYIKLVDNINIEGKLKQFFKDKR